MGTLKRITGRTTIGLFINQVDGRYQIPLWRGIDRVCRENDANLIVVAGKSPGSNLEEESSYNFIYSRIQPEWLDGLIVVSGALANYIGPEALSEFLKPYESLPRIGIALPLPDIPAITVNNRDSLFSLFDHLIEHHGYREVAWLGGPESNPEARERLEIYQASMEKHGIRILPQWIYHGDFREFSARNAVRFWLDELGWKPEAIVCANDDMALAVLDELKRRGFHVPEDVAVTGMDDISETLYSEPPLTTIHQPLEEQGALAAAQLLDHLSRGQSLRNEELHSRLEIRESCHCVPGNTPVSIKKDFIPAGRVRLDMEAWFQRLKLVTRQFYTSLNLSSALSQSVPFLKSLGIGHFYLIKLPGKASSSPNLQRLLFGYSGNELLTSAGESMVFPVNSLLPEHSFPKERFSSIMLPVFFKEHRQGFCLMSLNDEEPLLYEYLREQISLAWHRNDLYQTRRKTEKELRSAMEALQKSEHRFKDMAVYLPAVILETDVNGNLVFINQNGKEVLGVEEKSATGSNILQFVHPEERERLSQWLEKVALKNTFEKMDFRLSRKEEQPALLIARAKPYLLPGQQPGIRWIALDLQPKAEKNHPAAENLFARYSLSGREQEILELILDGYKIREISEKLHLAESTVKGYITAMYSKIGVDSRSELFELLKVNEIERKGYESYLYSMMSRMFQEE